MSKTGRARHNGVELLLLLCACDVRVTPGDPSYYLPLACRAYGSSVDLLM